MMNPLPGASSSAQTDGPMPLAEKNPFKGNKRELPSKPCQACGRPMSWRKRWARTWSQVKFCSDACRSAAAVSRRR
jgi:hypothetical protein